MKFKIIDILNKIAKGEEVPKRIYYKNEIFEYDEQSKDYYDSETYGLFDRYEIPPMLNDEVEILETTITMNKKIDNIRYCIIDGDETVNELMNSINTLNQCFTDKINEIIDKVNAND